MHNNIISISVGGGKRLAAPTHPTPSQNAIVILVFVHGLHAEQRDSTNLEPLKCLMYVICGGGGSERTEGKILVCESNICKYKTRTKVVRRPGGHGEWSRISSY